MDPLTLLLIGAAVGGAKAAFVDAPKAERERQLAAATQRYSPWTGLKANAVHEPDYFGNALSFGTAGAQLGYGMKQADLNEALSNKIMSGYTPVTANINAGGGNPYSLIPQIHQPNPFGVNPYGLSY